MPEKKYKKKYSVLYVQNHFCLISNSIGISFNKTIEGLKLNFEVLDNILSDKLVKSFIKYEHSPKKLQTQINNMVNYDIETLNNIKCVPYAKFPFKIDKISGENNRDVTKRECEKCRNGCVVFNGVNCFNEMLDHVLEFKGKGKRINNKIVERNL